jgi:two-component sensor histidine kinase
MMAKDTTGIVALDARRRHDRGVRVSAARQRSADTRVHRLLTQASEAASRTAMLLRESDHRIKNSLQIVSSLLLMQSRRTGSAEAADALKAAAAQVKVVSQIHDALQQNGERDAVKLGEVLTAMCHSLHAMAGDARIISIMVTDDGIETPVAYAQPIMLAVNELVINALRHAFPDDREGTIKISLSQSNEELCIVISDNGCGLPANHGKGSGYGSRLVRAMVKQIGGTLRTESVDGARFTITAPLKRAVPIAHAVLVSPSV